MTTLRRVLGLALLVPTLHGCDMMPDWFGEKAAPPLPGERISLSSHKTQLQADAELAEVKVELSEMPVNAAWPQALGNSNAVSGNLTLPADISVQDSTSVGDGNAFISSLIPAPVVAGGAIFALDGQGVISAHKADAPGELLWRSHALVDEEDDDEEPLIGGGVGYGDGKIYAVSNRGIIAALDAASGTLDWRKDLVTPLRSPPRITPLAVLVLSADNQLLALSRETGETIWTHRGISELSMPLHSTVPALRDTIIVTPYSSGELVALDQENGAELWNESLLGRDKKDDIKTFRHISPLMAANLTFAGSSESLTAFESATGRRLWEREVSLSDAPWLAGNSLFFLTTQNEVVAMRGTDGGIHWVRSLPKPDGDPILWHGPVVAGGYVWIVGNHGTMLRLSPADGSDSGSVDIPDGVMTSPIVVNNEMLLIDQEARLHVLK